MSCMNLISHHRGNFSSVECKGTTSTQRCSKKKGKKTYFDRVIIWYYHHHHYRHHLNVSVSQWYMKYSIAVLRLRAFFFFLTEEKMLTTSRRVLNRPLRQTMSVRKLFRFPIRRVKVSPSLLIITPRKNKPERERSPSDATQHGEMVDREKLMRQQQNFSIILPSLRFFCL